MTESFWFYLVEIERILSLQHFSKVKDLPLRFCLLNYSVITIIPFWLTVVLVVDSSNK